MTFQNVGHLTLEILKLEGGQKAERSQMERHDGRHRLLEQRRGVEQCAVTPEAAAEINLICQIIFLLVEGHQLLLNVSEFWVSDQHGVVHDGRLHKHDHPLLVDEPLDELDEGRDDRGIPNLLDDQHCQGGLVPSEPL